MAEHTGIKIPELSQALHGSLGACEKFSVPVVSHGVLCSHIPWYEREQVRDQGTQSAAAVGAGVGGSGDEFSVADLVSWQEVRSAITGGAERVPGTVAAAEIAGVARFPGRGASRLAPVGACG